MQDKYIKSLTRFEGKKRIIAFWAIFLTPVFFVIMGTLNLWAASKLSSLAEVPLNDIINIIFMDINPNQKYPFSGTLLIIMQRLETSMYQYLFSIPFFGFAYSMYFERKRDIEIIKILRKYGEI